MAILNLNNPGVKAAMRHPEIAGKKRIGRGWFAAVFDNGDTVLKLTCDRIQYCFYTDYCAPKGEFYPKLIENHGDIGEFGDMTLYLVEMEKLDKFGRRADVPDESWLYRRQLLRLYRKHYNNLWSQFNSRVGPDFESSLSRAILYDMSLDNCLNEPMREVCGELSDFCGNYGCASDFHNANFMLRDGKIVLNDVMADIESLYRHRPRW